VARILLIDDDLEFSEALCQQLQQQSHEVVCLDLAEEGLHLLSGDPFDLVLLDNLMPRMSGLEFLKALKDRGKRVPVILMTSATNDHTVIQATKRGAFGYVTKPVAFDDIMSELEPEIRKALEIARRPPPVPLPQPGAKVDKDTSLIVGRSKPMIEVFKRIALASEVDDSVLILGETGTGKDLVAQAIHTNSARKDHPFVVIDCTTLNDNLAASDLFGHEKSWYTGADKMRKGRFEHAEGGTIFLDEVGEMPLHLQAMLLRVLENREVVRGGSHDPIPVNVRVLAATHRNLPERVREGKFREDLFHRLEGRTIVLPPLRERKEDIELLAQHFLNRIFGSASAPTLHPATLAALRQCPWRGNIRGLRTVLCRAAEAVRGGQIMPEELDFGALDAGAPADAVAVGAESAQAGWRAVIAWAWKSEATNLWPLLQQQLENELLRYALTQEPLSEVQLARRLGIARNTLRKRLQKSGLEEPAQEPASPPPEHVG
jgi:DNA-binding NtrC family response regulator